MHETYGSDSSAEWLDPGDRDLAVRELQDVVYGGQHAEHLLIRELFANNGVAQQPGGSLRHRADSVYDRIGNLLDVAGPSTRLVENPVHNAAVFDCLAATDPDLAPALSIHLNLAIRSIMELGNGSPEQARALEALDGGTTMGAFLMTELAYGSNAGELQTTATWDDEQRTFTIHTPSPEAVKFMPNVAARVPKLAVVAARLKIGDQDEGVFPFIVPIRDQHGELCEGVQVARLPEKGYAPMDNAMIGFDSVTIPEGAWLSGDIARIRDGAMVCAANSRQRFAHTVTPIETARMSLAAGSVAAGRSALALTMNYANQRVTAGNIPMSERDNVVRDLTLGVVDMYAATALTNETRAVLADPHADFRQKSLMSMLAKPFVTETAFNVLQTCRERCGAQGMFEANYLPSYLGFAQGIKTAEGDNQMLKIATGRMYQHPAARTMIPVGDALDGRKWWSKMLLDREQMLATGSPERYADAAGAFGESSFAIELTEAVTARLAVDALVRAAEGTQGTAQELLGSMASAFALQTIAKNGLWFMQWAMEQKDAVALRKLATVPQELHERHQKVASYLPELVEAFDVPPVVTDTAFIGNDYVQKWTQYARTH